MLSLALIGIILVKQSAVQQKNPEGALTLNFPFAYASFSSCHGHLLLPQLSLYLRKTEDSPR